MTRFEGAESGIAEGAADSSRTELDATEKPGNDQQPLELALSEELEELHPGPSDLTVVTGLLHDLPVFVPHPARPAVVAGFVVPLLSLGELLLDLVERRHGNSCGVETRPLLGEVVFGERNYSWHARKDTRLIKQTGIVDATEYEVPPLALLASAME